MGDVCSVVGVRKTFEAELAPVRALRGVDLDIVAGEFVAIMGPSGCGKSTLLNLVAGLDVPDEGTITIADEEITGRSEDDLARMRRKHIGIVFQFFNLLESMTVLENVVLPAVIAGMKRKPAETRARDMLDLLGLGEKAKEMPGVLSGVETGVFSTFGLRWISATFERSSEISEKFRCGCHFIGAGFCAGGVFWFGFRCWSVLCVHRHLHVGQSFAAFLLCPLVFALLCLSPFMF